MVNKNTFKTGSVATVAKTDRVNAAGGRAYDAGAEHDLCQYVVTGCFNQTFYVGVGEQLQQIKDLVSKVSSELIAKAAVYGHENARMKDVPAYLLAVLVSRGRNDLVERAFPRVINTVKMLCNFVQIMRSGETGRRSFGSATKKLIQQWLVNKKNKALFAASIGQSNPSVADILKMVHARPQDERQNNMFAYLLDKEYDLNLLPADVRDFELLKKGFEVEGVPNVPFRALTNVNLDVDQWRHIGRDMPWNTLRMNLNMLQRKGVFDGTGGKAYKAEVVGKLLDEDAIRQSNCMPYSIMTAYEYTTELPSSVRNALQDALEIATENVPSFGCDVAVCVDVSASMGWGYITGSRRGATSVVKCVEVAALFASCIVRNNQDAVVVPFDTQVRHCSINPKDSIATNTQKLSIRGGATDCSIALHHLNQRRWKGDLVVFISDNESWADYSDKRYYGRGTGLANEWKAFKRHNKNAKLVLIDLTPPTGVQVQNDKDVFNVGGFSDAVFDAVGRFIEGGDSFVDVVQSVEL